MFLDKTSENGFELNREQKYLLLQSTIFVVLCLNERPLFPSVFLF